MNYLKKILLIIVALIISVIFCLINDDSTSYYGAKNAYRVYLNGKSIGLIESKEELESYINKEQQEIKKKYDVDTIYIPKGLEIKQELTYNNKIEFADNIYEEIKDQEPFTIQGYKITIIKENKMQETDEEAQENKVTTTEKILYVLDRKILEKAINNVVVSFLTEEEYNAYLEKNQPEIEDQGEIIENVYLADDIKIKKDYIPVNEEIFVNEKELTSYLLFGTTKIQKTYKVKSGDTIVQIANNNKLSPQEFLVANRNLSSEDSLLYEGQEVVIGLINPLITVVEELHKVERQTIKYKTEIIKDPSYYASYSEVVQNGVNGESRVIQKIKKENGNIASAVIIDTEELTPAVNKIIKTGTKSEYLVGSTDLWGWPTRTPYIISDTFRWRWGKMHNAIDITGTGKGSPIYAVNDGTVITARAYHSSLGNYIEINHHNGYITLYAHLQKMYVKVGQGVHRGDVIGTMGNTGFSTGTHLHFGVKLNGTYIDPFRLYR